MVRCFSLVCEAMLSLKWDAFESFISVDDDTQEILSPMAELLLKLAETPTNELVQDIAEILNSDDIQKAWVEFTAQLSLTGKYWDQFINMSLILLRHIEAERAGDWLGHLNAVEQMLPYMVAAKHRNYMACIPQYLAEMNALPESHPNTHKEFMDGNFTVHRTEGSFNGCWTDLALEQTYNKDGKSVLFKGITQEPAARDKYIKTVPYLTAVSEDVKAMVHMESFNYRETVDTDKSSLEDLNCVKRIRETILTDMINPFDADCSDNNSLLNISTGEKCKSTDLAFVAEKAIEAIKEAKNAKATKITSPDITTFSKSTQTTKKSSITKLYKDEADVTRTLCFVASDQSVQSRQEAFSHEWTSSPSSLFEPGKENGKPIMRKGTKSEFFNNIMKDTDSEGTHALPESPDKTSYLVDAMSFVQRYRNLGAGTFGDLQDAYLDKILELAPRGCDIIHFVADRYDVPKNESIKQDERMRRKGTGIAPEYCPAESLLLPDWTKLMSNDKNKENLLEFLAREWMKPNATAKLGQTKLIVATSRVARLISTDAVTVIDDLSNTDHEEADTLLMAHAYYSATEFNVKRICIQSDDTDVMLLAMVHGFNCGASLWCYRMGLYIPLSEVLWKLSEQLGQTPKQVANCLIAVYCLTGCDTVSFLFNRGKKRALKVTYELIKNNSIPTLMQFPDDEVKVTDDIVNESRLVIASLYGREHFKSLDTLREHVFANSKSDLRSLPPTEDAFLQHTHRAMYQLAIFKLAYKTTMNLPSAIHFGREIKDGSLVPVLMTKPSKPDKKRMSLAICKCKMAKSSQGLLCQRNCKCKVANQECIAACPCGNQQDKCALLVNILG
ncbi:unnamed protein product [Owenia fusiformis]|uniref:Tesmin/TSO1-like CXC domain-containing protein n=1 Tax=Owenia fusiformis TaxID=6347 RepID=A0A8S4PRW6_OWEFU|nr:unnamed protein product [Owenia fusiformis]